MSYLKDFRAKMEVADYPGFLQIWEEYCYSNTPDAEEIITILKEAKQSDIALPFGRHVDRALALWKEIQDPVAKNEVLKLILDIQTVNSEDLADIATTYLAENHQSDKYFHEKMRLIGLRDRDNFQGCLSGYDLLTHMNPGKFVYHTSGWGTGEIIEVSLIREEVTLEFEHVVGTRTISFKNALKNLVTLKDDSFLARRFGNPDLLEQEAKQSPLTVMHLLLKDFGPKTAAEIKEELYDLVIPAEDWLRWWQMARSKIKKDTLIETPTNIRKPFKLRTQSVSHEESLLKELEKELSINDTITAIYNFFRDFPETLKNEEFKASLKKKLDRMRELPDLTDAQKLQILFLLEELSEEGASNAAAELIKNLPSLIAAINDIGIITFKKKVFTIARNERSDWKSLFFDLIFIVDQALLREYLFTELNTKELREKLTHKLQELLLNPSAYPHALVWYFKKLFDGEDASLPFAGKEGQCRFFEAFMILLDHIEPKTEFHDLAKKMVQIITAGRFAIVRDIMQKASIEEVKEFLVLVTKCRILSKHDVQIFYSLAKVAHPKLKNEDQGEEVEDNIIWTTQENFEKIQQKLKHIATTEIVENAKEIEEARSHGDLRENAEFKAALEKKSRLQSEMQLLSSGINRACILTKQDVDTSKVSVGTIVECESDKGRKQSYTFLGPWDAEPEKQIFAFQSKMAQQIAGKKVGDDFEFLGEKFSIKAIKNYFD